MLDHLLCAIFCLKVEVTTIKTQINETNTQRETINQSEIPKDQGQSYQQPQVWKGYVSSYSATYGGCLGCTKKYDSKGQLYYTMANGEKLDDTKSTIAYNRLPLGTRVSLINLTNNKSVGAVVTDTGGFESLGRIADLSVATAKAIEAKTDRDIIEIREVPK